MKVIIAGCRNFSVTTLEITEVLERINWKPTEIISGCASGIDLCGEDWAHENKVAIHREPAEWETHGRSAGPIRNRKMASLADACLVFWDGQSRGTLSMISEAVSAKIPLHVHML